MLNELNESSVSATPGKVAYIGRAWDAMPTANVKQGAISHVLLTTILQPASANALLRISQQEVQINAD